MKLLERHREYWQSIYALEHGIAQVKILRAAADRGESVSGRLKAAESRVKEILDRVAYVWPPSWPSVFVIAASLGVCVCLAAWFGYGAYLRTAWVFALPISLCICVAALNLFSAAIGVWRRLRGALPRDGWLPPAKSRWLWAIACCSCFYCLGWLAGVYAREAYCRRICRASEPIIKAIDDFRARSGSYPSALSSVPDIEALGGSLNITIREAELLNTGLDLDDIEAADVTFYLAPNGYLCMVPIERKFPLSFTRFYVYLRESGGQTWKKDHVIWTLQKSQ